MRFKFLSLFIVFALSLALLGAATAFAQEACRCTGCGCKGGPGWRGPEGTCVSKAKLAQICGEPAGAPYTLEAATRVCFGKPFTAPRKRLSPSRRLEVRRSFLGGGRALA